MLFLLFVLVQPCQALSTTSKPRVVEASTTSTGAAQIVSPFVTAAAKPCGSHGLPNDAQKRAFRRARNRVAQAGPDDIPGIEVVDALQLTSVLNDLILHSLHHSTPRARVTQQNAPLSRVFACLRGPPEEGTSSTSAASRRRGFLSVLSLNLGGLTQHGHDELCTWLHTPAVRDQVDVICLQETWRLGSEYLLPEWFWISSGSAPVSGQGIAVLVNRKFAPDQTIRFREVQVGRLLHVVAPLQHCGGPRNLDIVCAYIPSKASESQSTYDRRDKSWTLVDRLLDSLPRRNTLYVAGDFNTDLHLAPPSVGVSYDEGTQQRYTARNQPRFQQCWLSTNFVLSILGGRRLHTGMRKVMPPGLTSFLHGYIRPAAGAFISFRVFAWPHGGQRKGMSCLAVTYPLMFGAWPLLHVPRLDMIAMPCAKHASQVPSTITCGKSFRLRRIFSGRRCPRPRPRNCCLMFVRRRFHAEPPHGPVCRGSFLR